MIGGDFLVAVRGTVSGTPVDIAYDSVGDVVMATSTGLYKISQSITILNSASQTGLVGVDLDDAGDVVAADSGGTVYVMNTGLSSPRTVSTGVVPTRSIAITGTGSIYIVGGPDGASEGDPHLTTIDGVRYDFQSAGEFVLFRHTGGLEGPVCGSNIDDPDSRKGNFRMPRGSRKNSGTEDGQLVAFGSPGPDAKLAAEG